MRKKNARRISVMERSRDSNVKGAGAWGWCLDKAGKTFPYGQELKLTKVQNNIH
jgi:hypothetical protein